MTKETKPSQIDSIISVEHKLLGDENCVITIFKADGEQYTMHEFMDEDWEEGPYDTIFYDNDGIICFNHPSNFNEVFLASKDYMDVVNNYKPLRK